MILNQTLTFNINENCYTFRTLNETDVSSLYINGLKENFIPPIDISQISV